MSLRSYLEALAPVLCAAGGGAGAHLLWQTSSLTAAGAVLGAAAGVVLLSPGTSRFEPMGDRDAAPPPVPRVVGLQDLLDTLPDASLLVSADRTIRHANAQAVELFGLPEAAGLPVSTIRVRRLLDQISEAVQEQAASTLEFSITRAGDTHLLGHIRPVGETGDVLIVIADRTLERKSAETHRDFVANASHELKTPLAAVSGIIETLLGHAKNDPAATERFLDLLSKQTERMTRLIQDLLSLNRVELNARVLPDEPVELTGVLSEVVDTLRSIADVWDVELATAMPETPVRALADRDEIGQLFRNLIDNAIKYGGKGSTVEIALKVDVLDGAEIAKISVRDQGPGIEREHLPRLTERFYRINVKHSRETGGTGLGLAICKHIANRHRGRLEVRSQLGEGSQFTLIIPTIVEDILVDSGDT